MIAPGNAISQIDMQNLANLANSKIMLQALGASGHYPYSFPDWGSENRQLTDNPRWLTQLNGLASDIKTAISELYNPGALTLAVSDFWPTDGFRSDSQNNTFFYEFKGTLVTISVVQYFLQDSIGSNSPIYSQGPYTESAGLPITAQGAIMVVAPNTTIQGDFYFIADGPVGSTLSVSGNFPGILEQYTQNLGGNSIQMVAVWHVNGIVPPGTYTVNASVSGSGAYLQSPALNTALLYGFTQTGNSPVLGTGTASCSVMGGSPAPGIDSSYPIYAFNIGTPPVTPLVYFQEVNQTANNPLAFGPTYWTYPYVLFPSGVGLGTIALVPSLPGFWAANTPALTNINVNTLAPWDILVWFNYGGNNVKANPMLGGPEGSYTQGNIEGASEPQQWGAGITFNPGSVILDSNGNLQQGGGTAGSNQPVWGTTVGAKTTDGTITWNCIAVPKLKFTPAVHRGLFVPRYPVYWYSETDTALIPPPLANSGFTIWGYGSQWFNSGIGTGFSSTGFGQGNLMQGSWIYSISLNRIGNNSVDGALLPIINAGGQVQQVSVTIGCMRNGSFVAFGTYSTGQTVQVMWPIFTTEALVYQCSERIDIQVVAINPVTTGPGPVAGYPMAASYVSDLISLLSLLS